MNKISVGDGKPTQTSCRSVAIIPAAGRSKRMGRDKLLLSWGQSTVLGSVIAAWQASKVDELVVVTRRDRQDIIDLCENEGVTLVAPEQPPPEMKDSVLAALRQTKGDVWLLAPADMPELDPTVIDQVLAAYDPASPSIIVPVKSGRRGHPVLFPWPLAREVALLGETEGVNVLLHRHPVRELKCQHTSIHCDLDTPEDYERTRPN